MTDKKTQPNEREFQNWFKSNWAGWFSQLHPGQGADTGLPDLLLGVGNGLLPVEIKIGSIDENNVLWTSPIRPAQISWHTRLANQGYDSILVVGVWCGNVWRVFAVDSIHIKSWYVEGFSIGETAFEIESLNLFASLNDFLFDHVEN